MRQPSHKEDIKRNLAGIGMVFIFGLLFGNGMERVVADEVSISDESRKGGDMAVAESVLSEKDLEMVDELEFLEFLEIVEDEDLEFFEDYEIVQDLQDVGGEYE